MRKRDGSTLTYAFDNLNRVIRKIVPERAGLTAAQTRDVYYDYNNAMGLQTKARFDGLDGHGGTTFGGAPNWSFEHDRATTGFSARRAVALPPHIGRGPP